MFSSQLQFVPQSRTTFMQTLFKTSMYYYSIWNAMTFGWWRSMCASDRDVVTVTLPCKLQSFLFKQTASYCAHTQLKVFPLCCYNTQGWFESRMCRSSLWGYSSSCVELQTCLCFRLQISHWLHFQLLCIIKILFNHKIPSATTALELALKSD